MQPEDEVISIIKHPVVVAARQSLARSGGRTPPAFLIDGAKMLCCALDAGAPLETVFFLDPLEGEWAALRDRARRAGRDCHRVSRGVFFRILGLGYETSARVLAVLPRSPSCDVTAGVGPGFCTIVGERIQDPRNVGVLIRTADAMGLATAVFSADSADPYCRASVRSTTGSIFRVGLALAADLPAYLRKLKAAGVRILGTSASAKASCWQEDLRGPCALVVGNETAGLSAKTAAACDRILAIPMYGEAHSLNVTVAAGILLYERARQRNASPTRAGDSDLRFEEGRG